MKNKFILISGCSSGIGYAAAIALKARGYSVLATARKMSDVAKLQSEGFDSFQLDVADPVSVESAWQLVLEKSQGQLYGLINNAGYGAVGQLEDITREMLMKQFETNVFGLHDLTRRAIPLMRAQNAGRIINISSVLGIIAIRYYGAYTASKFAVEGLSDTLRLELQDTAIKVITIEPGPIETKFGKNVEAVSSQMQQKVNPNNQAKDDPQAVVDKIILALEKSNPKPKYFITTITKVAALAKRLLPIQWMDRILARVR